MDEARENVHLPVLPREVIDFLQPIPGKVYVDMTVGAGGHARLLLERLDGRGKLLGFDRDEEILELARQNLMEYEHLCHFHQARFSQLDASLSSLAISQVDGFLFDIGASSYQLDQGRRGFSLQREGPLDMRMDSRDSLTAEEIINTYSEQQLARLFYEYGEESRARSYAKSIVQARRTKTIKSTLELAKLIEGTRGGRGRIHPATKIFQALRIEVNQELEELQLGLAQAVSRLAAEGRIVVISFHSLEDRIVKRFFKEQQQLGTVTILTKKPVVPERNEIRTNPRSRSAKLRCAQRN